MASGWGYDSLRNLILVLLEMKSGCKISGSVPTERVEGCGSVRAKIQVLALSVTLRSQYSC